MLQLVQLQNGTSVPRAVIAHALKVRFEAAAIAPEGLAATLQGWRCGIQAATIDGSATRIADDCLVTWSVYDHEKRPGCVVLRNGGANSPGGSAGGRGIMYQIRGCIRCTVRFCAPPALEHVQLDSHRPTRRQTA